MLPRNNIYKYIYLGKPRLYENQIDHVLIHKRQQSSIQDNRSYRGTDCFLDHTLIRIKICQRSSEITKKRIKEKKEEGLNSIILKKSKQKLQLELKNKFDPLNTEKL